MGNKDLLQKTEMEESDSYLHLAYGKVYMTIFGLWPVTYKGLKKTLYDLYFYFGMVYFCLFLSTQGVQALITLKTSLEEFAATIGVVTAYLLGIYRITIYKSSLFVGIIRNMEKMEKEILTSNNHNVTKIYKKNANFSKKIEAILLIYGGLGAASYYVFPIIKDQIDFRNATVTPKRHFIVSSWFPFDENDNYWKAYFIQFIGCLWGSVYVVPATAFYLSIVSFPAGQFKILQYLFINFSTEWKKYKANDNLNMEDRQNLFLKKLIKDHQKIIAMVEDLNKCMKTLTLLDFVLSSIQLAMMFYQILNVAGLERIVVFTLFSTLNYELYFLYWNGNEIFFQSEQVAISVYKSEWDDYPKSTVKMMQLVMLRAQKPVYLQIGLIGNVQLRALFQIYKAIYSYLCVFLSLG